MEPIALMMNNQTDESNERANLNHSTTSVLSEKNHLEQRTSPDSVNTAAIPERKSDSSPRDYSSILTAIMGIILSVGMLIPLGVLPGLIVVVLPAEIYVLGQVYDSITEVRSKQKLGSEYLRIEATHEENEDARVRVYGAHIAP